MKHMNNPFQIKYCSVGIDSEKIVENRVIRMNK